MLSLLIHIFNSTLLTLLSLFLKLENKRIVVTSTHNSSYNFNSSVFFEYIHIHHKDFEVYYVINDNVKRKQLINQYGDFFITNTRVKDIFKILRAKFWVSSTFELPLLSLLRNSKRVVLHMGHGVPLKNIGFREEKLSTLKKLNRLIRIHQFTDVICYSNELMGDMRKVFNESNKRYVPLGQPRNDNINTNSNISRTEISKYLNGTNHNDKSKFVLYAPTWRQYDTTLLFPFLDVDPLEIDKYLTENDIFIFLRSHPFYPSKFPEGIVYNERIINFDSTIVSDISSVLSGFEILLTDYSSIYFDFLGLGRIGFIPYDLDIYRKEIGFAIDYDLFTPGPKLSSQTQLLCFLSSDDDEFEEQRITIARITNTKHAGNCDEVFNYLCSLI